MSEAEPQRVAVTSVKFGPKDSNMIRKLIFGAVIIAIIAIIAVVSVLTVNKNQAAQARADYIENLHLVRTQMLSGAATAEELCNLTKSVWYNTIYEEKDSATDAFTMKHGKFNEDFNDSLSALYACSRVEGYIDEITENREVVAALMTELENPSDEFKSCYETVQSLYDEYFNFTGLAISPTGSLKTYSEEFNSYDTSFMRYYNKLDTQIPEEQGNT